MECAHHACSWDDSATQTLTGAWVDNGGQIIQSETTVGPQSSQVYVATNHGNGVQLELTFTTAKGAKLVVDTDVHKVDSDTYTAHITGNGLGITDSSDVWGNNPQVSITVADCTHDCGTYC